MTYLDTDEGFDDNLINNVTRPAYFSAVNPLITNKGLRKDSSNMYAQTQDELLKDSCCKLKNNFLSVKSPKRERKII